MRRFYFLHGVLLRVDVCVILKHCVEIYIKYVVPLSYFSTSMVYIVVLSSFFSSSVSSWYVNLMKLFLHDDTLL